ncbi:MAG: hypothetical protein ABI780_01800 [Ardenticatenales bacterium]
MTRPRLIFTLVAVSALVWPPSRRWIADVLISTGIHLDTVGRDPGPTPEQAERMRVGFIDELAAAFLRRRKTDEGAARPPDGRNGKAGDAIIYECFT